MTSARERAADLRRQAAQLEARARVEDQLENELDTLIDEFDGETMVLFVKVRYGHSMADLPYEFACLRLETGRWFITGSRHSQDLSDKAFLTWLSSFAEVEELWVATEWQGVVR